MPSVFEEHEGRLMWLEGVSEGEGAGEEVTEIAGDFVTWGLEDHGKWTPPLLLQLL